MPSLRARLANVAARLLVKRRIDGPTFDLGVVRQAMSARLVMPAALPRNVRVEPSRDAALRGEWLIPDAAPSDRVIVFMHGGAYIAGSPLTHRSLTAWLATESSTRVFSLDYRLAPEHPYPAGLDDAVAAIRRIVTLGTPMSRIALAGDSAGAGLVLAAMLRLRDHSGGIPAAAALICPLVDMTEASESLRTNAQAEPLLSLRHRAHTFVLYAGGTPLAQPELSPIYAELRGLPPMLVEASDIEVLWDDARRFVAAARDACVSVEFSPHRGLHHDWHLMVPFVPEATGSVRRIAAFLRGRLG